MTFVQFIIVDDLREMKLDHADVSAVKRFRSPPSVSLKKVDEVDPFNRPVNSALSLKNLILLSVFESSKKLSALFFNFEFIAEFIAEFEFMRERFTPLNIKSSKRPPAPPSFKLLNEPLIPFVRSVPKGKLSASLSLKSAGEIFTSSARPESKSAEVNPPARPASKGKPLASPSPKSVGELPAPPTRLNIARIGAAPFNTLAKQREATLFTVSLRNLDRVLNQIKICEKFTSMLNVMKIDKNVDFRTILPAKYHDFLNVFDRKRFEKFSLHKKYDHSISLLFEKISFFNSLYEMIHAENEKLKMYFKKNLNKR